MSPWGRLLNINLLTEDYRVAVLIRNTISFFLVLDNGTSWEDGGWRSLISARKISSFRLINIGKIVNGLVISPARPPGLIFKTSNICYGEVTAIHLSQWDVMTWRGNKKQGQACPSSPECTTVLSDWVNILRSYNSNIASAAFIVIYGAALLHSILISHQSFNK